MAGSILGSGMDLEQDTLRVLRASFDSSLGPFDFFEIVPVVLLSLVPSLLTGRLRLTFASSILQRRRILA